ncbi:putative ester cyclase [Enterococcus rotai]|uniref:Lipase n=1 Tax=Enterococcus rotai TaxID=118060 RepID=A0A0U2VL63_9ENTE|nr:ester cyclase [Enterococcus rotai]ALS38251.1 lipase [Enterococcus rotai]
MSEAKRIVSAFFENVRSGKNLQAAYEFMHEQVIAHQVQSENEYTITRSPKDYIEHVEEMQELYGQFELIIQEIVADENKVYVRWKQIGQTDKNKTIIQIASAVYLVERGKIAEYWIQIDRKGIENQCQ